MLRLGTAVKPLLPRWLRSGDGSAIDALRRRINRQFLYRGVSTLELRGLAIDERNAAVAFYARPIFPNDRRIQHRTREGAFSEQLFDDALKVLDITCRFLTEVDSVTVSAWIKTVDGVGRETRVLVTHATRDDVARIPSKGRLGAVETLRRYATLTCIDRHGNFHEEKPL
jgi:hypothetical protein